jgi:hypothetical protein
MARAKEAITMCEKSEMQERCRRDAGAMQWRCRAGGRHSGRFRKQLRVRVVGRAIIRMQRRRRDHDQEGPTLCHR